MPTPFRIRAATPDDAPMLARLIDELAAYEQLSHASHPNPDALRLHLATDAQPRCEALLAELTTTDRAIGFALFFPSYSTFLTRWGLYLEDLYVQPDYRGMGVGFSLLARVARVAVARGCERLDWSVLNWNEVALRFYEQIGATPMKEWTMMRLTGKPLQRLGQR